MSAMRSGPGDREREPRDRVVQVHAVVDQLDRDALVLERRRGRPGLAVVERRASRCRGGSPPARRASNAARAWSYVASVCPIAATRPGRDGPPDDLEPPGQLGRDRDHPHARPAASSRPSASRSGVAQQRGVVRAVAAAGSATGPRGGCRRARPPPTSGAQRPRRPASSSSTGARDEAGERRRSCRARGGRPRRPAPRRDRPTCTRAPPPPCTWMSTNPGSDPRRQPHDRRASPAAGPTSAASPSDGDPAVRPPAGADRARARGPGRRMRALPSRQRHAGTPTEAVPGEQARRRGGRPGRRAPRGTRRGRRLEGERGAPRARAGAGRAAVAGLGQPAADDDQLGRPAARDGRCASASGERVDGLAPHRARRRASPAAHARAAAPAAVAPSPEPPRPIAARPRPPTRRLQAAARAAPARRPPGSTTTCPISPARAVRARRTGGRRARPRRRCRCRARRRGSRGAARGAERGPRPSAAGADVVAERHRQPEPLRQQRAQRQVAPAEVGRAHAPRPRPRRRSRARPGRRRRRSAPAASVADRLEQPGARHGVRPPARAASARWSVAAHGRRRAGSTSAGLERRAADVERDDARGRAHGQRPPSARGGGGSLGVEAAAGGARAARGAGRGRARPSGRARALERARRSRSTSAARPSGGGAEQPDERLVPAMRDRPVAVLHRRVGLGPGRRGLAHLQRGLVGEPDASSRVPRNVTARRASGRQRRRRARPRRRRSRGQVLAEGARAAGRAPWWRSASGRPTARRRSRARSHASVSAASGASASP